MIRQALVDARARALAVPARAGAAGAARGRGAAGARAASASTLDPDTEIVPTYGSKEAIFSLAQVLVDPRSDKRVVVFGEPAYPVYERGALFAGARVQTLPLLRENGFLPDLDATRPTTTAIVWVNYPHNPTGAVAPLSFYEQLAELAASARLRRSPPTRRTASCGSTSRRRRRCRSPTARA